MQDRGKIDGVREGMRDRERVGRNAKEWKIISKKEIRNRRKEAWEGEKDCKIKILMDFNELKMQ